MIHVETISYVRGLVRHEIWIGEGGTIGRSVHAKREWNSDEHPLSHLRNHVLSRHLSVPLQESCKHFGFCGCARHHTSPWFYDLRTLCFPVGIHPNCWLPEDTTSRSNAPIAFTSDDWVSSSNSRVPRGWRPFELYSWSINAFIDISSSSLSTSNSSNRRLQLCSVCHSLFL